MPKSFDGYNGLMMPLTFCRSVGKEKLYVYLQGTYFSPNLFDPGRPRLDSSLSG